MPRGLRGYKAMNEEIMREGKILPLLVQFSVPAMIGMVVNAIYNIVDRMFIGNAPDLGSSGLAGITISFPITLVMLAVALMVAVGAATRFSIALGKQEKEEARFYQGNALLLTILIGVCFTIFGLLFMNPLLKILGASSQVLPLAEEYLRIILYGAAFQCVATCGNNFSRAQGNPNNAMISMLIGAGFNILFDYILIVRLGMGMQGAALATIGGQFLSMVWQLTYLLGKRTLVPMKLHHMLLKTKYVFAILKTGLPVFLMQMANSVLNVVINSSLVTYGGDIAVSTVGIITSFQTLLLMPITGLCQGQQPLISFNFGAQRIDRVKETLKYAIIGASIITMIGFLCVQLFPHLIISMFNQESAVLSLGSKAIRVWFMCLPVVGAQAICANYFQAIGRIKQASVLNLMRQCFLLIPLIIILSSIFGLYGIFFAVPLADIIAFSITAYVTKHELKECRY